MRAYTHVSTLVDTLFHREQHSANHIALVCGDQQTSYAELANGARHLANSLSSISLQPNDRVVYLGKESIYFYELLFACALQGIVLVPVNWRLTEPEIHHILNNSGAKALFFDANFLPILSSLQTKNPQLATIISLDAIIDTTYPLMSSWKTQHGIGGNPATIDENTVIVQLYTSGTTGLPKGVELAHRSFFKIMRSLVDSDLDWIDCNENDISLIAVPSFHVGGLWFAMQGLTAGSKNILIRDFTPQYTLDLIVKHQVSITCMVPSMIQSLLLEHTIDEYNYNYLRKIIYGGAPISESLLTQAITRFQCEFVQIYGLTETGNTAVCLPASAHTPGSKHIHATGIPYPCVTLKIMDKNGKELPEGEIGEVCINTPAAMLAYWNLPEATSKTLIDDWIYSGDAGYMEDGYLYICDRIKDTIIVAGENIYPSEVENVLSQCPGIQEIAVIGIPDDHWGEAICAVIVRDQHKKPVSPRDIILFSQGKLASFKVPHKFEFSKKIPRNPSGKILRRELRNTYWQHMKRNIN